MGYSEILVPLQGRSFSNTASPLPQHTFPKSHSVFWDFNREEERERNPVCSLCRSPCWPRVATLSLFTVYHPPRERSGTSILWLHPVSLWERIKSQSISLCHLYYLLSFRLWWNFIKKKKKWEKTVVSLETQISRKKMIHLFSWSKSQPLMQTTAAGFMFVLF